jgi:CTP synthase
MAYCANRVDERHRHRFELNNEYRERLQAAGLVFSGMSPSGLLVEVSELKDHPYMLGSQFHPEFKSRPTRPHPLFRDFIAAACNTLLEGDQRPLPLEQVLA